MPKAASCGSAHKGSGRPKPSLSALSGFASAKASTYDKKARKQKERALNSKVVNKYRKLKARLQASGGGNGQVAAGMPPHLQEAAAQEPQQVPHKRQRQQDEGQELRLCPDGEVDPTGKRPKHGGKQKKLTHLQRIAAEKAAERAEVQRQQEERRREAEHRKEEAAKAQQLRKKKAALFRKRTRTGQPVMKFRIGKMLEQLQSGNV